jgi:outer membrane protein assembly factor BamD
MKRNYGLWALGIWAVLVGLTTGCDPCGKLAKSKNLADKDSAAFCYFGRGQYESAGMLFEELMNFYRGTGRHETILFYFASSKFNKGEYITAAYFFQQFMQQYPNAARVEEAAYYIGESYYRQSNRYNLDQSETARGIEYYQLFIELYPGSERVPEAEKKIRTLRDKLAKKSFSHADLYLKIGHYKAAVIAFQNTIQEYPDSDYREEAQFKLIKAAALYAQASIPEKQVERYQDALDFYNRYTKKFPSGKYAKQAESIRTDVHKQIDKLKAQQASRQETSSQP